MHTEAFLVFKDQFTAYLRNFIIELQQTALKIQESLHSIEQQAIQSFVKQVIVHKQKVPRFEDIEKEEHHLLEKELDKWNSLNVWFLGSIHGESDLEMQIGRASCRGRT